VFQCYVTSSFVLLCFRFHHPFSHGVDVLMLFILALCFIYILTQCFIYMFGQCSGFRYSNGFGSVLRREIGNSTIIFFIDQRVSMGQRIANNVDLNPNSIILGSVLESNSVGIATICIRGTIAGMHSGSGSGPLSRQQCCF
jgi:hypothetical protein